MKPVIIYIGGFDLPDRNAAAQRVVGNAKVLKALGHDVYLIGLSSKRSEKFFNYEGIKCYNFKYPTSFVGWIKHLLSIKCYKNLILNIQGMKNIFLYNFPSIPTLKFILIKKKLNFKLFSDVTEWPVLKIKTIKDVIKKIDIFLSIRIFNKKTNGLIVISEYLDFYYRDFNNKILIPPLVDKSQNKWLNDQIIDEDDIDGRYIIYAGEHGKGKDQLKELIEDYCEVLKNVNLRYKLVIVGTEIDSIINHFKISIDRTKLENDIVFIGRVNHEKVIRLTKRADFTIIIRKENRTTLAGFPTKFVESISAGTPVICSSVGDVSEVIYLDNKLGFLIDENNSLTDIFHKVNALSFDEINEMKKHCLSYEKFSYKKYIKTFEELLT